MLAEQGEMAASAVGRGSQVAEEEEEAAARQEERLARVGTAGVNVVGERAVAVAVVSEMHVAQQNPNRWCSSPGVQTEARIPPLDADSQIFRCRDTARTSRTQDRVKVAYLQ